MLLLLLPLRRRGGGGGGVREVGPVTYLLPLPTHTRLTELEKEEEEESGRAGESDWKRK